MEHAALHALLLTGLIVALGGPVAVFWLFIPSYRLFGKDVEGAALLESLCASAARWVFYGALVAALATFIDFFEIVAELNGQTVFAGADISTVIRFATHTTVGNLCLARLVLLLLTALATWLPRKFRWWLVGTLAFGAIIVTGDVSHAAAQPGDNPVPVLAQIAHITAAALWMGVLLQIFMARRLLLLPDDPSGAQVAFVAGVVRRFSPLALATTSLLGITGVIAAWRYLDSVDVVIHSPYGLTLLVKLAVLTPAIYAGFINFRRVGPALARLAAGKSDPQEARGVFYRFSRMLELEVTAGVLVITVAGILGSVSPPGDDGAYRLTPAQARAFLHPHRPNTNIQGWDLPDDPLGTSVHEMRYAEFTHNWSGVMVCLMGISWLAQSAGGRASVWAGRFFPFLLLVFGMFIALAANPEVWILHRYTIVQAIEDPILLEHQLGGVIVFILAWLTWRDRKTPVEKQPLGYPLPIIMIVGSLLLLGHAHTLSTVPDDLTNLINTQHAVFGALGLFAGTTRLLMLRGLVPARAARFAWPSFVICLGIFMTFFYREVV